MADDLFLVQLVTPERVLFDRVASEVILRTGEGDTTFLAGHTPLVGTIEPGVIRVVGGDDAGEVRVAGHGGFVQVENDVELDEGAGSGSGSAAGSGSAGGTGGRTRVTLLVGVAELAEEIDTDRARAALEAAQERVTELGGSRGGSGEDERPDAQLVDAEAAVLRAEVRLEAVDASAGAPAA